MTTWTLIFVSPACDRVATFKQNAAGRTSIHAEQAAAKVVETYPHIQGWRLAAAMTECRDLCVMVGSQRDQLGLTELM